MMDAFIIFCAQYLFLLSVLVFLGYWYYSGQPWHFLKVTLMVGVLALALSYAASHLYNNPRPFMEPGVVSLIYHAPGNGFPSDHALFTGTLAAVVTLFNPYVGAVLAVLAVVVSVARVLANVHHYIDIIASFMIAIVSAGFVHYYLRRPEE